MFPATVQSVGREAAGETCRHCWFQICSSPIKRGTGGAAGGGEGKEGASSVQHRIQLVGQVVKHVADVFQDVLGRVHGPRVAGEERERVKALLKGCSY